MEKRSRSGSFKRKRPQQPEKVDDSPEIHAGIVRNLKYVLSEQPQGKLFCDEVRNKYLQHYVDVLPCSWIEVAEKSKEFAFSNEVDILGESRKVISLKPADMIHVNNNSSSSDSSPSLSIGNGINSASPIAVKSIPRVSVPEGKVMWPVRVQKVQSPTEVYVRFAEYEREYVEFVDKMMTDYLTEPLPAGRVQVGNFYIALSSTKAARVEALSVNENEVKCRFIDTGFVYCLAMRTLHKPKTKYLEHPAFAVPVTLNLLEDLKSDDVVKYLENYFKQRKSQIFTAVAVSRNASDSLIVELFTSPPSNHGNTDDISVNLKTVREVKGQDIKKKMSAGMLVEVKIVHNSPNGVIWVQVLDEYLQKLFQNQDYIDKTCENNAVPVNILASQTQIYYAKSNGHWCRAMVSGSNDSNYDVFFVDYGFKNIVNLSEIRHLDWTMDLNRSLPFLAHAVVLKDYEGSGQWSLETWRNLFEFLEDQTAMMFTVRGEFNESPVVVDLLKSVRKVLSHNNNKQDYATEAISVINDAPYVDSGTLNRSTTPLSNSEIYAGASPDGDNSSQGSLIRIRSNNELIPPTVLPAANSELTQAAAYIDVFVSFINNPNDFYIQRYAAVKKLEDMAVKMKEHFDSNNEPPHSSTIQIGKHFAGYCANEDKWYRVELREIFCQAPFTGYFFCCDYGQCITLKAEDIRVLPYRFKTYPQQAMKASLNIKVDAQGWSESKINEFKKLAEGKPMVSRVAGITEINGDEVLQVELVDTSTDDDIWIHTKL